MIKIKNITFQGVKQKFQVKKPWDDVIIFVLNILIAVPATAVGSKLMLSVLVEVTLVQLAFEAVSVKITFPTVISSVLGV